jgi:hypothetical protein
MVFIVILSNWGPSMAIWLHLRRPEEKEVEFVALQDCILGVEKDFNSRNNKILLDPDFAAILFD